jgi:hypothetical protein
MRTVFAVAAFPCLLALAACGNRGFELPDGRFDRDGYRSLGVQACQAGLASENASIPTATGEDFCGCLLDRLLAENSDDELRAIVRDSSLSERKQAAAAQHCTGSATAAPVGEDEPPPPDASPPPPLSDGTLPPPVVQPVDGNRAD